jgi:hypothetical protein
LPFGVGAAEARGVDGEAAVTGAKMKRWWIYEHGQLTDESLAEDKSGALLQFVKKRGYNSLQAYVEATTRTTVNEWLETMQVVEHRPARR